MKTLKLAEAPTKKVEGSALGTILVQAGRLSIEDMLRVAALQGKENILFGEAAVSLGILSEEDVRWALACQYSYPCTTEGQESFSKELLVVHEPFSSQVESFRSIRSALILSGVGNQVKSIAVVSPGEGEGKTFFAANLAVVFAQLGSRTLLVDLNFRAPRVHCLFNIKNNCGASSLIIKRALLEDAIQKTAIPSLDILPSGPKPPNPLELLTWTETQELLGNLENSYDFIIVDTPPFNKTADGMLISGICDGTVVVARKGLTKNAAFGQLKKQLDDHSIKIIGSVVNDVASAA